MAVAVRSVSVSCSTKHLVTPTDVADEEQQEDRIQDPDGLAPPGAEKEDGVDEVDGPRETKQRNGPLLVRLSGREEGEKSRGEQIGQCPETDIDREQRGAPGGSVENDSSSKGNGQYFWHGFLFGTFPPAGHKLENLGEFHAAPPCMRSFASYST